VDCRALRRGGSTRFCGQSPEAEDLAKDCRTGTTYNGKPFAKERKTREVYRAFVGIATSVDDAILLGDNATTRELTPH
jgi:hypothetical protein